MNLSHPRGRLVPPGKGTLMMRVHGRIAVVVGLWLASASAAVGQGLYWESRTSGAGSDVHTMQNYAMPKMLKSVDSKGLVLILRLDHEQFLTIDPRQKAYRVMSFSELGAASQSMQARMEAARGEMEKKMKDMSPEQRAAVEKMLAPKADGAKQPPVEVKSTGETKVIAGQECTKYVATQGDQTILVAWTSKDVKGFDGLRDDWIAYQKRLANTSPALTSGTAEAFSKLQGFPMETQIGPITMVVTKVEARTTPTNEFEVPAGYRNASADVVEPPKPPTKP